ncbi:conserved exported hypothetical protein [Frankia sp. Hr75.2]|nr:conserved exported hypothetical protein [Frankia sp. Hr75.2]
MAATATATLTAVNYSGMRRAAWLTRLIVVVLTVLVVVACVTSGAAEPGRQPVARSPAGRRPAVLRLRRLCAHRDARRGGP